MDKRLAFAEIKLKNSNYTPSATTIDRSGYPHPLARIQTLCHAVHKSKLWTRNVQYFQIIDWNHDASSDKVDTGMHGTHKACGKSLWVSRSNNGRASTRRSATVV